MERLISNTAFGEYLNTKNIPDYEYRYLRSQYDQFLLQKLELWQFVPCKLVECVWVVLEFPDRTDDYWRDANGLTDEFYEAVTNFNHAKNRVLFEGFEFKKESKQLHNTELGIYLHFNNLTVEVFSNPDTSYIETVEDISVYNLILTASAKKTLSI